MATTGATPGSVVVEAARRAFDPNIKSQRLQQLIQNNQLLMEAVQTAQDRKAAEEQARIQQGREAQLFPVELETARAKLKAAQQPEPPKPFSNRVEVARDFQGKFNMVPTDEELIAYAAFTHGPTGLQRITGFENVSPADALTLLQKYLPQLSGQAAWAALQGAAEQNAAKAEVTPSAEKTSTLISAPPTGAVSTEGTPPINIPESGFTPSTGGITEKPSSNAPESEWHDYLISIGKLSARTVPSEAFKIIEKERGVARDEEKEARVAQSKQDLIDATRRNKIADAEKATQISSLNGQADKLIEASKLGKVSLAELKIKATQLAASLAAIGISRDVASQIEEVYGAGKKEVAATAAAKEKQKQLEQQYAAVSNKYSGLYKLYQQALENEKNPAKGALYTTWRPRVTQAGEIYAPLLNIASGIKDRYTKDSVLTSAEIKAVMNAYKRRVFGTNVPWLSGKKKEKKKGAVSQNKTKTSNKFSQSDVDVASKYPDKNAFIENNKDLYDATTLNAIWKATGRK